MSTYDDLVALKGKGSVVDNLVPVSPQKLKEIAEEFKGLPKDYLSFLGEVGAGECGKGFYMIYDGLVDPDEIYGDSTGFESIKLLGDDFQGFNAGFDVETWVVVEIDPTRRAANIIAPDFQSFIRSKIDAAN